MSGTDSGVDLIDAALQAAERLKDDMDPGRLKDAEHRSGAVARLRCFRFQCLQAILASPHAAVQNSLPELLWRVGFYKLVAFYRAQRPARNRAADRSSTQDLSGDFQLMLAEGSGFYINLVHQLQHVYNLPSASKHTFRFGFTDSPTVHISPARSEDASKAVEVVYSSLIHAGDLARYAGQAAAKTRKKQAAVDEPGVHHGVARRYYTEALRLQPGNGCPYNQLAVLSTYDKDYFTAGYFYIRNKEAVDPFSSADDNLHKLFRILEDTGKDIVEPEEEEGEGEDSSSFEDDDDDDGADSMDESSDDDNDNNNTGAAKQLERRRGGAKAVGRRLLPGQRAPATGSSSRQKHRRQHGGELSDDRVKTTLLQFAYLHACLYFDRDVHADQLWSAWRPRDGPVFARLRQTLQLCTSTEYQQRQQRQQQRSSQAGVVDSTLPLQLLTYALFSVDNAVSKSGDAGDAILLLLDLLDLLVSLEVEASNVFILAAVKIACSWLRFNTHLISSLLNPSPPSLPLLDTHHPLWRSLAALASQHATHVRIPPDAFLQWQQSTGHALPEDVLMLGFKPLRSDPFFAALKEPPIGVRITEATTEVVHHRTVVAAAVALCSAGAHPEAGAPIAYRVGEDESLEFSAVEDERESAGQPSVSQSQARFRAMEGQTVPAQTHDDDDVEDGITSEELYGVMERIMTALEGEDDMDDDEDDLS